MTISVDNLVEYREGLGTIISRSVSQISDIFPPNTKIRIFLILLALIFASVQKSPFSVQSFEITSSAALKLSYNFLHLPPLVKHFFDHLQFATAHAPR